MNLLLKQERTRRGWSRATVEAKTGIPQRSLENWEEGGIYPRSHNIDALCKLYGKTAEELGFDKAHDIMGATLTVYAPQEGTPMSDLIRREVFSNLGSRLTSLIDLWPRRDYRYEELQEEINKAIFDHHVLAPTDSIAEIGRREALKSMALLPLQGIAIIKTAHVQKTDNDLLLKRCAAGIMACWYLRRGRDLVFVSDLMSTYISLLQPLILSHSETHRKAGARLLAQSFILRSKLTSALQDDDQAISYEEEALRYARLAENGTEQIIANREMALLYYRRKKYGQALPYAETAYHLAKSNKATPKIILSFTASGLSFCQAASGYTEEAKTTLGEGHDLFDPMKLIPSVPYNEAILTEIDALIHRHTGNFKEAINFYEQYRRCPNISLLGAIENNVNYAKTEVARDDQARDMALCVTLLTESIIGAKELGSKWYIRESREAYDMLRLAWPREDAIKKLGRDHFGTK